MKKERRIGRFNSLVQGTLLLICLFLFFGCAPLQVAPSGFLKDYQKLKADSKEEGILWWELPGVSWNQYKAFLIDPVEVRIDTTKAEREMKPEEMEKLAVTLRRHVIEALKDRYAIVNQAGPGVLRIRAALTHLKPVSLAANLVAAVILMMPVDVGEAAVEVQFIDSRSGKVLGELVATKRGSLLDLTDVWSRWTQVEEGFKEWAKKLRAAIDEGRQGTR